MGSRGITYFINGLHGGIHSRIKTDGILGTGNVQIDGSRKSDGIDPKCCQLLRTCKGTVSSDDNNAVNTMFSADLCASCLSFRSTELCTAGSIQNSTSTGNSI